MDVDEFLSNKKLRPTFEKKVRPLLNEYREILEGESLIGYVPIKRAATLLDVHRVTLNLWVRKGMVKMYAIGGRRYFKVSELKSLFHEVE